MPSDTAELQAWRASRPTRFRALRAYSLTVRILAGYLWLRLWRPFLGPSLYEARLVRRHRRNSKRLTHAILDLSGLFIKVGQLISILTNFLPPEFREELEQLQDSVPARPLPEVIARIRKELGKAPTDLFAEFDPVPVASASLAQVHVARMHDGRKVAVKVQHADIEEIAKLDLEIIGRVIDMIQMIVRVKGMEQYEGDIAEMIRQELDFRQEAKNIATLAANFSYSAHVKFPVVVPELSSERVLTTEFVEGTKVTDLDELDRLGVDRKALAARLLEATCQMVFVDGVFHADPHPGNIIVHPNGSFTLLDLGAIGRLSPNVKQGVPRFWDGIIKRDPAIIIAGLRQAGLISREGDDEEMAERAINYVHKRFLDQMQMESFSLKDIQVDMKTKVEALADLRKLDISFRDLSRTFQVPKEWVLFERASLLLLGLCTTLDPSMNPIKIIGPYLTEFVLGKDRDIKSTVTSAVRDMAMSAIAIPDKTNRLLDRANSGEARFQIGGMREGALLLYAAGQQAIFVFLAIALGVLGFQWGERGRDALSAIAWIAAVLCLIVVFSSMWSARKLKRMLRQRKRL